MRLGYVVQAFAILSVGHVVGKLLALGASVLMAHGIGPASLGVFAVTTTLFGYVLILSNWGTDVIGIRRVAMTPDQIKPIGSSVVGLRLLFGIVGTSITFATLAAFGWNVWVAIPLALSVPVYAFRTDWMLLALGRPASVALAAIIREAAFLVSLALLLPRSATAVVAAWCYLVADAIWALSSQALASFQTIRRSQLRRPDLLPYIRDGWPMVITATMSLTHNKLDTPLLAVLRNTEEAGIYWAAYTVIFAAMGFSAMLSRSALPEMARAAATSSAARDSSTSTLTVLACGAGGLAAVGIFTCADVAMRQLYGSRFAEGAAPLRLLALTLPMNFASGILLNRLVAIGRQRWLAIGTSLAAVANVLLNLALIRGLGMEGAAIATLASEGLLLGAGLVCLGWGRLTANTATGLAWVLLSALFGTLVIPRVLGSSELLTSVAAILAYCALVTPAMIRLWRRRGGVDRVGREDSTKSLREPQWSSEAHCDLLYVTRSLAPYRVPVFQLLRERGVNAQIIVAGRPPVGVPDATEEALQLGIPTLRLASNWLRRQFELLRACYRFPRTVLVIEHGTRLGFAWTLLLAKRIPGTRRILWTHGIESRELYSGRPNLGSPGRWLQLMLADGMLCYDQEMAEKLGRRFPKKWTSAAPNSTDGTPIASARRVLAREGRAALRRRHGLHRAHYLVGVGRMVQKKEFHRLPGILRRVKAQIQDVGLILVGDGPARARVDGEVRANNLIVGQDVHFVGDVWEPAALTEWVFCADVNVSPGYVGLAAVDSLFAGVPMVISRPTASGPYHSPEWKYLRDGPGGLIASANTDAAMAQRVIDYLRESEASRREREAACIKFAEERLGISLPVQRLMELARGVPPPSANPLEAVHA